MTIQRTCAHCQHNFGGFCTAKGFGQAVESDDSSCELWEISEEFMAEVLDAAPWYLKRPYKNGKLSQTDFLDKVETDAKGLAVAIELYDAIEEIYGMTQQELAAVLGVSSDVVGYAKAHGTVKRRIPHFSQCLCIPEEFFKEFSTAQLSQLKKCSEEYKNKNEKPELL